jgi:hypothetical protein
MGTYSGAGGMLDAGEGVAARSFYRPDPPLHILFRQGGEWRLWCSGGRAEPASNVTGRHCSACRTLLREYKRECVENGDIEPTDMLDTSWGV